MAPRRAFSVDALMARPAGVAVAFAPIAFGAWWLVLEFQQTRSPDVYTGLRIVQTVMLVSGLALFASVVRRDPPVDRARSRRGWRLALLALALIVAAQAVALEAAPWWWLKPFHATFTAAEREWFFLLGALAHQVLFIAAAEELWFRGLWMRAAGDRAWLAIGVGAVAFGLLHWPAGLWSVATTAAIGALFGAARWRGAPLWSLALVHGLMNWLSIYAAPASWRFGEDIGRAVIIAVALGGAAAFLAMRPDVRSNEVGVSP